MSMLKTTVLLQVLIINRVFAVIEVGIRGNHKLIEKFIESKIGKLSKGIKLSKSQKSKGDKLAKSKKPSKIKNYLNLLLKKLGQTF